MKELGFRIVSAAVLLLPLCGQVATYRAGADIPFEFVVRNTTVPSGTYVIKFEAQSVEFVGRHSYRFVVNPVGPYTGSHEPKLVFHRYGNRYFLAQVRTNSTSRDVPMSRVEHELKIKPVASARQIQTEIVLAMR